MSETVNDDDRGGRFGCRACGRNYAWKPALAGRHVKCKCGEPLAVPVQPPTGEGDPTADGLYDIAPAESGEPARSMPVVKPAHLPAMAEPKLARASTEAAPALGYARGATQGEAWVDRYFPDRVKDLYMPLAMILGGTVIEAALAFFARGGGRFGGRLQSIPATMTAVGLYMLVNATLMLATVFVVAKLRGISFGPVLTAVVKLCGISIGPGAAGSLVGFALGFLGIIGRVLGWIAGFALYFASIGALFDLDESDTWAVVIAVFLAKLFVAVVVIGMLFG